MVIVEAGRSVEAYKGLNKILIIFLIFGSGCRMTEVSELFKTGGHLIQKLYRHLLLIHFNNY